MLPKVGVGVLVLKEGKTLLEKRNGSHGEGTWSAPGGHLEFGETVVECACRELMEETALKAENVTQCPTWYEVFFPKENKHYINLWVIVTKFSGEIEGDWHWFDIQDPPEPLFESMKKILPLDLFIVETKPEAVLHSLP